MRIGPILEDCSSSIRSSPPLSSRRVKTYSDKYPLEVADTLHLRLQHPHPRDFHITFREDTHSYTIVNREQNAMVHSRNLISVSSIAHDFFEEFDAEEQALRLAKREDLTTNSRYRSYHHITSNDTTERKLAILEMWEANRVDASTRGTRMHEAIEHHYNGVETVKLDTKELGYFCQYRDDIKARGWKPYRTEWRLWTLDYLLCGTIDMVFIDQQGRLHMADWKRSKKIKRRGFKKGSGPCRDLWDCNFNHYMIQLNTYTYIIENYYGCKIESMHLGVFHPINDGYLTYDIPRCQSLVRQLLAKRKQDICAKPPVFIPRFEQFQANDVRFSSAEIVIINGGYAFQTQCQYHLKHGMLELCSDHDVASITHNGSTLTRIVSNTGRTEDLVYVGDTVKVRMTMFNLQKYLTQPWCDEFTESITQSMKVYSEENSSKLINIKNVSDRSVTHIMITTIL
jgi:hypothetical protein